MKIRRIFSALVLACGVLLGLVSAPPAMAETPGQVAISGAVSDAAGVLTSAELTELENRAASVQTATGYEVYVVFVDRFDSADSSSWVTQAARNARLPSTASLIAIATGTRKYSYVSGSASFGQSAVRNAFDSSALSDFGSGQWADGANAVLRNLEAQTGSANNSASASPAGAIWVAIIGVLICCAVVIYLKRRKSQSAKQDAADLKALAERASRALVTTDDGVRQAGAELEFARAQFGLATVETYANTLQQAQQRVAAAFEIRKQLDDDVPETPAQQRQMNQQILTLTEQAQTVIKAQAADFGKLRDLSSHVTDRLTTLETQIREIREGLPGAKGQLDALAGTYSPAAVASLRRYPEEIEGLLSGADDAVARAREQISAQNNNGAVPYVRIVEQAVNNALLKYRAIANAQSTLNDAAAKLTEHIASISSDIQDARRLGGTDSEIAAARAAAEQAVAQYSAQGADPLAGIALLTSREADLDAALVGVRSAADTRQRQVESGRALRAQAAATIEQTDHYINQYQRLISNAARTSLATAKRNLAAGDSRTDPTAAIGDYQNASANANAAFASAQEDVTGAHNSWSRGQRGGGGNGWGGFLAGMLLSDLLNDHHSSWGGGFGGFSGGGGSF